MHRLMRSLWLKSPPFLSRLEGFFRRKTVRAFAEQLASLDDLEPALGKAVRRALAEGEQPEQILYAPSQSVLQAADAGLPAFFLPWEITPTRALVLTSRRLWIASRAYQADEAPSSANAVELLPIPFEDILCLEMGFVLLNAWFEVDWLRLGGVDRVCVRFNTVSRILFEDLCARVREAIRGLDPDSPDPKSGDASLTGLPFKFSSLIPHHLLLPDECIQAVAFRPAIWERKRLIPPRRTAPRLALVRTDAHLILAHETLSQAENDHSWVGQILPRRGIRSAVLQGAPPREVLVLRLGPDQLCVPLGQADRQRVLDVCSPFLIPNG